LHRGAPEPLALAAFPIPCRLAATLAVRLPSDDRVDIALFDVTGRSVARRRRASGRRSPPGLAVRRGSSRSAA